MFEATFRNKRVFVTGHTGFKGAWLMAWLHQLGAEVKGYALPPKNPAELDLFTVMGGDELCHSVLADIRDGERLRREVADFQPDFVFHLAAQPLVRRSYQEPIATYETNVLGTGNVILSLQEVKKPCTAILITTDKVYENREWAWPYREMDRLGGYDPYSSSKAAAELLISSFRNSFFPLEHWEHHQTALASARAGNVIGGGDWAEDRIVPDLIRALKEDQTLTVRNPKAVRPWQHVLEPLGGYLHLAARLAEEPQRFSGAWNFGPLPQDNKTVEELVQLAIERWGSGHYQTPQLQNQPHEAHLLKLDINQAAAELGWQPKMDSLAAIRLTLDWYRAFLERPKEALRLLEADIAAYNALTS